MASQLIKSSRFLDQLQSNKIDETENLQTLAKIAQIQQFLRISKFQNQQSQQTKSSQIKQIQKLFKLYDQFGSQWKFISHKMANKTPNNLKNLFYTVIRNLMKLLFRINSQFCPKVTGEIPSKELSRLYDGKQYYSQFKQFLSKILKQLDYNLRNPNSEIIIEKYSLQIRKIYQIIYRQRQSLTNTPKEQIKAIESKKQNDIEHYQVILKQEKEVEEKINNKKLAQQTSKNQELIYYYFFVDPMQYVNYVNFYF